MIDCVYIETNILKNGVVEVSPQFKLVRTKDLMIKGGDFYAVWLEDEHRWSTDEQDVVDNIDRAVKEYAATRKDLMPNGCKLMLASEAKSNVIDRWHKFCKQQLRDKYVALDGKLIFSNMKATREDYSSKKLSYPLQEGSIANYDKLMSTLYSPEERKKLEWAVGSIIAGKSTSIQKFVVLYGSSGTGKSTFLNILEQLFKGYYTVFNAAALGSTKMQFAFEPFKDNPLVGIQHDGDLSRIEDNTNLNSLISHEYVVMNEKNKSTYPMRIRSFLFMGTNKPVKITDSKSGIIRRLIDVSPTGDVLPAKEYDAAVSKIQFELGAIAYHCLQVYLSDPRAYDHYIPLNMIGASNDFFNFVAEYSYTFEHAECITLAQAWVLYRQYCIDAAVPYPYSQRIFKEELKSYFDVFQERGYLPDGTRVRSIYSGFKQDKFFKSDNEPEEPLKEDGDLPDWLNLHAVAQSQFDIVCADCQAQEASKDETPKTAWDNVTTTLSDIDPTKVHYVRLPKNHIVIDFDIPDKDGKKDLAANLKAASEFPQTYAETSKSGGGLHLHYIYDGDPSELSDRIDEHIEIKVFSGKSSLRRKLTVCNDLDISHISSGLPKKERSEKKTVDQFVIKNERQLRKAITANINKEVHPYTTPSMNFIKKILDDAYESGVEYDVRNMYTPLYAFATSSTNQKAKNLKTLRELHLCSEGHETQVIDISKPIAFFDCEVYPNLFVVAYKLPGEENNVIGLINPSSSVIAKLCDDYNLIGFNNLNYDNHILYARILGYDNEALYSLSKNIIGGDRKAGWREAKGVSYTDVYDFSSKKQTLKKFELEINGALHQEMSIPWDKPVPKSMWQTVVSYCMNDVAATEATFNARKGDFESRQIIADLASGDVNTRTNALSEKIVFQDDRHPQSQFNYRDLGYLDGTETNSVTINGKTYTFDDPYFLFNSKGQPVFSGYSYIKGVSTYRGEEVGEGGYVYAEPGAYRDVTTLDISSAHPHTIKNENLFGDKYTQRYFSLVECRLAIKHGDIDKAKDILRSLKPGAEKYLDNVEDSKQIANALKIVINSVYGLTAAHFDNSFKDPRNKDNIVAKRAALFMVNLKHAVQEQGYRVIHIKTDSIKIHHADQKIIDFVKDYGAAYGYFFEIESVYDRICLVNDAVYIAKEKDGGWTATGAQFKVPYVFKALFSNEEFGLPDFCELRSVKTAMYLDLNETLPDVSEEEKELKKIEKLKASDMIDGLDCAQYDKQIDILNKKIEKGHEYRFVGRVGEFCPVKPGSGGGLLVAKRGDKYSAVTGTKGYRWLESEVVRQREKYGEGIECIDISYYEQLAEKAKSSIIEFIDNSEEFTSFEDFLGGSKVA